MSLLRIIMQLFSKRKRVDLVFVSYLLADEYLAKGYSIAEEEDNNSDYGRVYLELVEKNNET